MRITAIILLSFLISFPLASQNKNKDVLSIVFYNVENLFDTIDAPEIEDQEFTPGSEKKWNQEKYQKKLEDLGRVLSSIMEDELPDIIGLSEVENKNVLEDLIETTDLRKGKYQIVHKDSPDDRGIDVALLYRKKELKDINYQAIRIEFPFDPELKTRDILHVEGLARDGEKIHFFVNHWSSRWGGMLESEPKRIECALNLRRTLDDILSLEENPRFIIMGDFNDEPTNRSVMEILGASNKRKNIYPKDLYNLYYDLHNLGGKGTYNYRGNWNMLDHIIISYNLIDRPGYYSCSYEDAGIFKADWMLYETRDGIKVPNRTYGGPNYYGGISDHFPVYLRLGIRD
ncbi:MAG: endonuclease/exonuclease/phosphatase family protein [Bacteroidales bacterium]